MDRTAFGCQPDQQGSPQVPAAELDQSLMSEFDSVLDEAGLAKLALASLGWAKGGVVRIVPRPFTEQC